MFISNTVSSNLSTASSSKKQKVSGAFLDQSIEQLNDVTAVSGVNLRVMSLLPFFFMSGLPWAKKKRKQ